MKFQRLVTILLSMAAVCLIDSTEAAQCVVPTPVPSTLCPASFCPDSLAEGETLMTFTFTTAEPPAADPQVTITNEAQREYFTFAIGDQPHILLMKASATFKNILDVGNLGAPGSDFKPSLTVVCAGTENPPLTAPYTFASPITIVDTNNQRPTFEGPATLTVTTNLDDWEEGKVINPKQLITLVDLDNLEPFARIQNLTILFQNNTAATELLDYKNADATLAIVPGGRRHEKKIELVLKKNAPVGTHKIRLSALEVLLPTPTEPFATHYDFNLVVNGASQIGAVLMVTLASIITTWVNL